MLFIAGKREEGGEDERIANEHGGSEGEVEMGDGRYLSMASKRARSTPCTIQNELYETSSYSLIIYAQMV